MDSLVHKYLAWHLGWNSHHPNPAAVGLVASFLLSYKFTIWEWSCKRPERNNKNPLWSNKKTHLFHPRAWLFSLCFPSNRPTGPQVLVQDLCTQDLEDSKLNGEDPSNCLKQTKKHIRCIQNVLFFSSRKPPPHWFMGICQHQIELPRLLGKLPSCWPPKNQIGWICELFPPPNPGHFGSMK